MPRCVTPPPPSRRPNLVSSFLSFFSHTQLLSAALYALEGSRAGGGGGGGGAGAKHPERSKRRPSPQRSAARDNAWLRAGAPDHALESAGRRAAAAATTSPGGAAGMAAAAVASGGGDRRPGWSNSFVLGDGWREVKCHCRSRDDGCCEMRRAKKDIGSDQRMRNGRMAAGGSRAMRSAMRPSRRPRSSRGGASSGSARRRAERSLSCARASGAILLPSARPPRERSPRPSSRACAS